MLPIRGGAHPLLQQGPQLTSSPVTRSLVLWPSRSGACTRVAGVAGLIISRDLVKLGRDQLLRRVGGDHLDSPLAPSASSRKWDQTGHWSISEERTRRRPFPYLTLSELKLLDRLPRTGKRMLRALVTRARGVVRTAALAAVTLIVGWLFGHFLGP